VLCIEQIRPTTIVCRDGGTSVLVEVIQAIQEIEGIRMTIEIKEIVMIVIDDAGTSEAYVEMGRAAANERGPDHRDGTTVMVKIRQLSRRWTDESTHRCCVRQLSTMLGMATSTSRQECVEESSWTCTMAVRVWRHAWRLSRISPHIIAGRRGTSCSI